MIYYRSNFSYIVFENQVFTVNYIEYPLYTTTDAETLYISGFSFLVEFQ